MKRIVKFITVALPLVLVFNLIFVGTSSAKDSGTEVNGVQNFTLENQTLLSDGSEVSTFQLNPENGESPVIYDVTDNKDTVTVIATQNGVELDRAITDKRTGTIKQLKNEVVVAEYKIEDHVTIKSTESNSINENEQSIQSAQSQNLLRSAYNSGIGQYGYLYGDFTTRYGDTYTLNFGVGTSISIIVGALASIVTGTALVVAIITALGSTVVANAITSLISGDVFAQFKDYNLEVRSQGKVGLVSKQTIVNAKVNNYRTGGSSWVYLRTEGDGRSWDDLCIIGAYNVYLQNL
jgi:hypothetical protein|nr:hypothetical protein [Paenibacillus xylanexedens]